MVNMRSLLRRLTHRPVPTPREPVTRHHGPDPWTRAQPPLRPWQVRDRCFNMRRRGLDPVEIRAFLHRVADELTTAQTALVAVQEENIRIKTALRKWQTAQSASHDHR
ncbi:DivIVA domain-containing protein [Salinispora arenicola]|uniref:DivIVA domain-containing protein n=1 Tax=Salinispora arenicola TaxID=168697 RepID=UPI0020794802|nr:DivIVA domain-containing protein [Salinispora arenicola]MCN0153180.1 DivIVA domain-containing protein [Salinispora arenicola]